VDVEAEEDFGKKCNGARTAMKLLHRNAMKCQTPSLVHSMLKEEPMDAENITVAGEINRRRFPFPFPLSKE
jgi:hypothetical protein